MTSKNRKTISSWWILMLIAILNTLSQNFVGGLGYQDKTNIGPKPKGTLKTIRVPEDGDIIDCVDFYKQPAFDNPLIKKLKTVSNLYVSALNKTRNLRPKPFQTWNKYGKCPEGTVPIRRTWANDTIHQKVYDDPNTREYATVYHLAHKLQGLQGGRALFNIWRPRVIEHNEFSLSQMWVNGGPYHVQNTVEVGWMVYPKLFRDSKPRLFTYWTSDNYRMTGCYNAKCPGFVQTSFEVTLGGAWDSASVYDGEQISHIFEFYKASNVEGGDWWLRVGDYVVGFYPRSLFPYLGGGADYITFGGEIVNSRTRNRHTTTTMGSGRFSAEGFQKACVTSQIYVKKDDLTWVEANLDTHIISKPTCYDLTFGPPGTNMGSHFYFGGPGLSQHCQ